MITVVTAAIDMPPPKQPQIVRPGVRWIAYMDTNADFCDAPWPWETVRVSRSMLDPRMDAKKYKVLIHEYHEGDTVWIDSKWPLSCDPEEMFESFSEPMAFVKHFRGCPFLECVRVIQRKKDTPANIARAHRWLNKMGIARRSGLWMGGLIFRRDTPQVRAFNRLWWRYILETSVRDQICLPAALRDSNLAWKTLPSRRGYTL